MIIMIIMVINDDVIFFTSALERFAQYSYRCVEMMVMLQSFPCMFKMLPLSSTN
jgi:hypothetical protein